MPYCSAHSCNNINIKNQRAVIVSLPVGETRTEAMHGFVTALEINTVNFVWRTSKKVASKMMFLTV